MATASAKTSNSATEKAAKAAHDAVDRAAETAENVEKKVRDKAEEIRDNAEERYQQARQQSGEVTDRIIQYVDEKPLTALGIAFVAGMVISSILRK